MIPAFRTYAEAEAWAAKVAGDAGVSMVVVEDFRVSGHGDPAPFLVMDSVAGERYVDLHGDGAAIQYRATPPTSQVGG